MKVISYGGGVQSTALLALAANGKIDYRTFLFANVGDDSENPGTLKYLREVAAPYAAKAGLDLRILDRRRRDGTTETLWQRLNRPATRSIPIPVRMANGAPGRRSCTADFKIKVVGRWLRGAGATKSDPATVGIGISVDEIHRANRRRCEAYEVIEYPLLDLGLRRADCLDCLCADLRVDERGGWDRWRPWSGAAGRCGRRCQVSGLFGVWYGSTRHTRATLSGLTCGDEGVEGGASVACGRVLSVRPRACSVR
ncbi:hypothetical protein [Embleya sp. NPDC001921]